MTVIRGARIFAGERVLEADSVRIDGDRIVEVGLGLTGDDSVDAQGQTLLPGLIDAHTHTPPELRNAERSLRQALGLGVTTVLCLNTDPATAAAMKSLARARADVADLRSAHWLATVPGSHPTHMDPDFPVLQGIPDVAPYIAARLADAADYIKLVIEDGSIVGRPMPSMALASVARLRTAGVPMLAGTDAPNPGTAHGASIHHELELLVRGGLSPIEALASATSLPAKHFRLHDRGRIAPGLRADLVLVDGDPTTDIDATRSVTQIWRGGTECDRSLLRTQMAEDPPSQDTEDRPSSD